jgi:RHS repeat-associated protein
MAGANSYYYDGLGQRVENVLPGGTMVYAYDAFGKLIAEYSTAVVGSVCTTCYLSWDHLGSVRMVTDGSGSVKALHDYAPFGQEIPAGVSGRTGTWGVVDYVNPRFTGQVRDSESGLDYFNARYLASGMGRFMSVDPYNAGADVANPQSWNGYGYVLGNPLGLVDPSGMGPIITKFGPPSYLGSGSASCTMDGVVTPCGLVSSTSAVLCPNNSCNGLSADANGNVFLNTYSPTPTLNCVGESVENFQCSWARWSAWLVQNWAETRYFGSIQQLFNGNQQLWRDAAGAGNALGVGTAAVVAAPIAIDLASTALYGGAEGLLAGETPVIGKLSDTSAYLGQSGYNVLLQSGYGLAQQATWMGETVVSGQSFLLASPVAGANGVFATEVGFLQGVGYQQIGSFLVPPVP